MKNLCLYSALGLAIAMTGVHVFVGGRLIAAPLLESSLAGLPLRTLYLVWHGLTIVLAGMALLAADALFWRKRPDAAYLLSGLAGAFALLGFATIARFGVSPLDLPQWILFAPMSAAAFFGARAMR
ncbi:MAG: hypothetical protein WD076_04125 [Parvularculaceae bacterium]